MSVRGPAASSSSSVARSDLDESSVTSTIHLSNPQRVDEPGVPILPFAVCALQAGLNTFLHFGPGAFCGHGTSLGFGQTFVVEKHGLKGKKGLLLANPFDGAEKPWTPSHVAVKKIRRLPNNPQRVLLCLERELIALRCVIKHANVVRLLGLGWEPTPIPGDGSLWPALVMELADHGTLADLQSKTGALKYETKAKFCLDVTKGLKAIHGVGLSHGDLKSENVLIFSHDEEGFIAKVSDLGFSSAISRIGTKSTCEPALSESQVFQVCGATELWATPDFRENATLAQLISRDVYSWGMLVLRVLLDGALPFHGAHKFRSELSLSAVQEDPPPLFNDTPFKVIPSRITLDRHPSDADIRDLIHGHREMDVKDWSVDLTAMREIKSRGRVTMREYAAYKLKLDARNDVQDMIPRLKEVLYECFSVVPGERDLDKALAQWR